MRARHIVLLILAATAFGCAKIKTKQITFYRHPGINGDGNIQINVIYPPNELVKQTILEMTPAQWFDPENAYRKSGRPERLSIQLDEGDFFGVPDGYPAGSSYTIKLDTKQKKTRSQRWLIVMAGPLNRSDEDQRLAPNQGLHVYLYDRMKTHKKEHVRIHQGFIERLSGQPRIRGMRIFPQPTKVSRR